MSTPLLYRSAKDMTLCFTQSLHPFMHDEQYHERVLSRFVALAGQVSTVDEFDNLFMQAERHIQARRLKKLDTLLTRYIAVRTCVSVVRL